MKCTCGCGLDKPSMSGWYPGVEELFEVRRGGWALVQLPNGAYEWILK